jgi:hypothetical protein
MFKMASHEPFRHVQHKLWSKQGSGVKLTTKSRESTWPHGVQVECDTLLESSQGELQLCFRPHPNRRFQLGIMSTQSPANPNHDSFQTPPWESQEKKPFGCKCMGKHKKYYMGKVVASPEFGSWWVKWVRVARGLSQHPKCFRMWTNQLVGWFWCRIE